MYATLSNKIKASGVLVDRDDNGSMWLLLSNSTSSLLAGITANEWFLRDVCRPPDTMQGQCFDGIACRGSYDAELDENAAIRIS